MGRMLIEAVLNAPDMTLAVALAHADSALLGQDAGAGLGCNTGVIVTHDLETLKTVDCLIDFTRPTGTRRYLAACLKHQVNMVIGTTGLTPPDLAAIAEATQQIAIVCAPNMSIGVNAMLKLLDIAARLLRRDYDVEIFEAHHRNKIDAPSGTALKMGATIAAAWGLPLSDVAQWARHGNTGPRQPDTIGFSVVRGGDIIGDHTAHFCGIGERIEITHRSQSRDTYTQGSLRAAAFLQDKKTGLYDMQDVLEPTRSANGP
jgi:4-hydroxy-tetrahydrodipicolinate reductase